MMSAATPHPHAHAHGLASAGAFSGQNAMPIPIPLPSGQMGMPLQMQMQHQQQQHQQHQQQQQHQYALQQAALQQQMPELPPKRPRFKVEYRPLHMPLGNMGAWDERAVASTFPKYNIGAPSRSVHDLGVVDMDAVLMSLRSRMPKELGYAITVLSMLSMPHPEEGIAGLPLAHITEIYEEMLDLLAEKALGDDGLERWRSKDKIKEREEARIERGNVLSTEMERLGRDIDSSIDSSDMRSTPDIILSVLNLLRNFSLLPDNFHVLAANPDIFHLLAAITDHSLCTAYGGSVFTVVELARVQRDAVSILSNLGFLIDLRVCEPWAVGSLFRLLSSFIVPAWETLTNVSTHSPIYAASPHHIQYLHERPPVVLSIGRALETWCKISQADTNREVLARIPSNELVFMYSSLIKLLPLNGTQFRQLYSIEDSLCFAELVASGMYSLAFLASSSVRNEMRKVPGGLDVIVRMVVLSASPRYGPAPLPPGSDFKQNVLNVLCRRLAETLGVLNGTWTPGGDVQGLGGMSFSAGGIEGKGWTYKSKQVENGWMAGKVERVMPVLFDEGLDPIVWSELDGLLWGLE